MNNTKISRRSFLAAAGIAGAAAALTACGSSASSTASSVAGSAAASYTLRCPDAAACERACAALKAAGLLLDD